MKHLLLTTIAAVLLVGCLHRGDWEAVIAIQCGIAFVFWSVAKYYNYQIRKLEHNEVVSESEK